jgi:hypothetical protein
MACSAELRITFSGLDTPRSKTEIILSRLPEKNLRHDRPVTRVDQTRGIHFAQAVPRRA